MTDFLKGVHRITFLLLLVSAGLNSYTQNHLRSESVSFPSANNPVVFCSSEYEPAIDDQTSELPFCRGIQSILSEHSQTGRLFIKASDGFSVWQPPENQK